MNKTCVLIPHFNNPEGLYTSIESINEGENLDILIVDDGSFITFDSSKAINLFQGNGVVTFIFLETNQGITNALNFGLRELLEGNYTYVARLDCSDTVQGERFKLQEDFMENNLDIGIVGSNCIAINPQGNEIFKIKLPERDSVIRKKMFLNSMFIHPAIMIRLDIIRKIGLYRDIEAAEDYDLFFRILSTSKGANIQCYLMKIQIDDTGISATKRNEQLRGRIGLIKENFKFGFYPLYGLLRSWILIMIPRGILNFFKRIIYQ